MSRLAFLSVAVAALIALFAAAPASAYDVYATVDTYKGSTFAFSSSSPDTACPVTGCTVTVDLNKRDLKRFKTAFGGTQSSVTIPGSSLAVQTSQIAVGGPWSMALYAQWLGVSSNPFGQDVTVTVSVY
ncbi:MAG TPA: hypothetical protein VD931_12225 [Baekduia sp.]|nr:hypothetical protein [Baekduia sp.]